MVLNFLRGGVGVIVSRPACGFTGYRGRMGVDYAPKAMNALEIRKIDYGTRSMTKVLGHEPGRCGTHGACWNRTR